MKIALIGYGKMGKTIEGLAHAQGHEIVLRIDRDNSDQLKQNTVHGAEVAIEFSRPEVAVGHLQNCFDIGLPVVSGTTGWLAQMEEVQAYCRAKNGAFFYAS
ncbi:MAG: 4-hydroxy-tetrahydrodipicolinate reductase, partial [Bacteroidota bacterium]